MLKEGGAEPGDRLSFVAADLENDAGWSAAVAGCEYVGALPGCPQLYFGIVDVRDVADIHLRAMADPAAKGERFLATAESLMRLGLLKG
jgi:hypothetical protein